MYAAAANAVNPGPARALSTRRPPDPAVLASLAAAGFLTPTAWEAFVSPLLQGRQIMQSGPCMSMVRKSAGLRRLQLGDPVYFCFCNLLEFRHYRLGFDRVFFIGEVADAAGAVQEAALAAQRAALAALGRVCPRATWGGRRTRSIGSTARTASTMRSVRRLRWRRARPLP